MEKSALQEFQKGAWRKSPYGILPVIEAKIDEHLDNPQTNSYVGRTVLHSPDEIFAKIRDRAGDVSMAGMSQNLPEFQEASADLLYDLAIALRMRGLSLQDAVNALESRVAVKPAGLAITAPAVQ